MDCFTSIEMRRSRIMEEKLLSKRVLISTRERSEVNLVQLNVLKYVVSYSYCYTTHPSNEYFSLYNKI